jgi:C4-dicarboxylate transporter DctM subunit
VFEFNAIAILVVVAFFVSLAIGLHIGFALVLWGILGLWLVAGKSAALGSLGILLWDTTYSFSLASVPLFILMGAMAKSTGLASSFFRAVSEWIGHLPGGLALSVTVGSGVFAAASGSSLATAAAIGSVSISEMKKRRYSDTLATGTVAAAGTFGILIPPSIPLIIYGYLTETSIGQLFMAGVIPGIITVVLYGALILLWVRLNPAAAPRIVRQSTSFTDMLWRTREAIGLILLVIFVLGGIFWGVFTATEAGGMGAGAVSLYGLVLIQSKKSAITWKHFADGIRDGVMVSAMLLIIIVGGHIFSQFLTLSGLADAFANLLVTLPCSMVFRFILIILLYVFLGTFMENIAVLTLTIPLFEPLMAAFDVSPVWFAILVVKCLEMALVTPPLGLNVYVVKGIAPEVPIASIFKGIAPFLLCDLAVVILLLSFPDLALYLPGVMAGQ